MSVKIKTRTIREANLIGHTDSGLETICLRLEGGKVAIAPGCLHEHRAGVSFSLRHFENIVEFVSKAKQP